MLFVVSLYAIPAQLFPALEVFHPTQVIAISALLLLILEKMMLRQSFVLGWPEGYLLLAFVGAAVLSIFAAFWPLRAYEASLDLVRIVIAYFLIVNTVVTEKRLRAFLLAMVVGGLFPALGTLNGYIHGDLLEGRAHWMGVFGNPNELAYILVMLVPLAAVLADSRSIPPADNALDSDLAVRGGNLPDVLPRFTSRFIWCRGPARNSAARRIAESRDRLLLVAGLVFRPLPGHAVTA